MQEIKKYVEDNKQLLHLSAYIHRNPKELRDYKSNKQNYYWSSYQDFVEENRFNQLLRPEIILEQFKNKKEYLSFLKTSLTKLTEEEYKEQMFG